MKKHSTKQLLALISFFVIILVALHFVAFIFIRKAGVTVSTLERDVASLQVQVQEFSKYSAEDLRELAKKVSTKIVARDGIVGFLENIESTARAYDMEILVRGVDVRARSEENTKDTKEFVQLSLETRGSWQNNMKFVHFLEHLPYKVELRNVTFTKLADTLDADGKVIPTTRTWRAEIILVALKFK